MAVPIRCTFYHALCTTDEIRYIINHEEVSTEEESNHGTERQARQQQCENEENQSRRVIITSYSDLQYYYDEAFRANNQEIMDVLENGTVVNVNGEVVF